MGALLSRNEFLIGVDADVILEPETTVNMMRHFVNGPKVGAVTGNPRVRTRSTLLGRIQVGEFSAIIGLIKRAQRVIGPIYTVSGAIVGFRKSALHRVGYWSDDMITEDIDISWKLQLAGWEVRYEPDAICWILTPETYKGLWQQRLRWAQGGVEVASRYFTSLGTRKAMRLWTTFAEFVLSVTWAFAIIITFIMFFLTLLFDLPDKMQMVISFPSWTAFFLGVTCLIQFGVSFFIDSRYEEDLHKFYFWIIWYPFIFWIITTLTTLAALPKGLNHRKGEKARWVSPDRGL
jgi:biofilm PGA synthesis N-glycosyltransferase PgaC